MKNAAKIAKCRLCGKYTYVGKYIYMCMKKINTFLLNSYLCFGVTKKCDHQDGKDNLETNLGNEIFMNMFGFLF